MKALSLRGFVIALFALAGATVAVAADPYPSKPIRLVVTSAAGGLVDTHARLVAKLIGEKLGRAVVVDNQTGAGGLVALRAVKAAPADGYTLVAVANTIVIQQVAGQDPGYDVAKDFIGIGPISRSPFLLVASPNQPDKSLPDLLARAKANPGKLTYASAGNGSTTHLTAALFAQRGGVNLLHVPYKGNSAAWPDLMSGRVGMLMEAYGPAAPMMKDGRLKALGVTSSKRMEVMPDVPTIAEAGVPGYSFYLWVGMFAPAATPKDVVQTLSGTLQSVLNSAEIKTRFREEGSEVMAMSPEQFGQFLKDEVATMSKLVADLDLPKQ